MNDLRSDTEGLVARIVELEDRLAAAVEFQVNDCRLVFVGNPDQGDEEDGWEILEGQLAPANPEDELALTLEGDWISRPLGWSAEVTWPTLDAAWTAAEKHGGKS